MPLGYWPNLRSRLSSSFYVFMVRERVKVHKLIKSNQANMPNLFNKVFITLH